MELRHIRYFLAVAEERNFTRAAARLGIGQPPLSLQIRDLEKEIGAPLFHRVPHGAELTEAGQAFLEAVAPLVERADQAIRAARRAGGGETGRLSVGFTGTAAINPIVAASIRAFRNRYPDAELALQEANSIALVDAVLQKRLDMAIIRPSDPKPDEIEVITLESEALVAALPSAHPAARGRGGLDLLTLRDEPFILTPRTLGIGLHDAVLRACRAAGFEPRLGQPAPQIASILALVSGELGVSLVPACTQQFTARGVTYRTLRAPAPRIDLALAWRRDRPSRLVTNFVALARDAARPAE
ncbi:LysR substrate-binding domain-containing protein [Cupriavidus pauculus]|uniref:Transcriptional regulator n=1 Tax=Cupriavidus pauculus TaxID=82633 RepID=A0A2N5CEI1_9BURK|nr:LysR substrate-binding domain-containing protein [Cupriavidus pauculus]PLQ00639.1 transcriptional regulator [Cupriavidus pauculus]